MDSEIKPGAKAALPFTHRQEDWFERLAFGASFLCLVHCLALPMVFALLPAMDRVLRLPDSVHVWILLFAIPTSLAALIAGRARHRTPWPLLVGICGLAGLALGALMFARTPMETILTVCGSLLLVTAHLGNWRLRHIGHGRH